MPDSVTVQEVAPVQATRGRAFRLFLGKFIVDTIETFAATAGGVVLFLPASTEDWRKIAVVVGVPLASSAFSALRRGWPTIKAWLLGNEPQPVQVTAAPPQNPNPTEPQP
jgi:hypothetical protein